MIKRQSKRASLLLIVKEKEKQRSYLTKEIKGLVDYLERLKQERALLVSEINGINGALALEDYNAEKG